MPSTSDFHGSECHPRPSLPHRGQGLVPSKSPDDLPLPWRQGARERGPKSTDPSARPGPIQLRGRRARSPPGFTLLELLLAITLLGLLAILLAGGVRLGARVWESGDAHADDLAQLEVVQGFLRRQLSQAHPLRLAGRDAQRKYVFEGESEALRFAVLAPPQFGLGGFYIFTIDLARGEVGEQMRLTARLYHPEMEEEPDPEEVTETVLMDRIEGLEFAYFGALRRRDSPDWHDSWLDQSALPSLVRLTIEFAEDDDRAWPELVVAPRISR